MKYPITNKNKPFHNSGVRKQDSTKTYHPRNPGSGKTHNNSGKSAEEYEALAQAAMEQGDRILAQTYYQYSEHALRIRSAPQENITAPGFYGSGYTSQNKVDRKQGFEASLEKELAKV
jgi:hypothetical protein